MNKKYFASVLVGLFLAFQSLPGVCSMDAPPSSNKKNSKSDMLIVKSYSKDEEISKMNFNHSSTSDTSLGYLTQGNGYDMSKDPVGSMKAAAGAAGKVLQLLGQIPGLQGLMVFGDLLQMLSGDTMGCAVAEADRAALLGEELDLVANKMVEYSNLKNTTEDVMSSWGEEKTNAAMDILRSASADDYKDLIDFENTPVGEQDVYGKPQSSIGAARQYVKSNFFYDVRVKKDEPQNKAKDEQDKEVDRKRKAYISEVVLNSLGASYAYSSIGVEESGNREKDVVEHIVQAKNWDEMRAAEALADLNVVREQIVNLSLQMRLLELMAVDRAFGRRRAWAVPLSPEGREKQAKEMFKNQENGGEVK